MGCSNSKVDDLPAVSLCRERLNFLDQAIHYRYALAQSHIAYIHSLKSVGHSLHNFIHQQDPSHLSSSSPIPGSPRKPDPAPKHAHHQAQAHALNHDSDSGHLDLHSDSDEDDDDSGGAHHIDFPSGDASPNLHHIDYPDPGQDPDYGYGGVGGGGSVLYNTNYMKNKATPPSVVYEQRPPNPETVYMGESSNSGYAYPYYGNNYDNPSASPYSNYGYGYPNSNPNPNFNNSNGYYANSPNYGGAAVGSTSNSKPPPPPPSPPRASAWDFLNPFESYDKFYSTSSPAVAYTPSRDSKVREEEGIPELEEDNYYHREVVKEVHGDQKFVGGGDKGGRGNNSKAVMVEDDDDVVGGVHDHEASTSLYEARPRASSGGVENDGAEYEVHVVEKKVVGNEDEEGRSRYKGLNVFQLAREIEVLFERASEFGNEVARLLEVGKLPYNRRHPVSSKILHVVTPSASVVSSHPSTSKGGAEPSASAGLAQVDADEDVVTFGSRNLSSTLQKLYLWEKKLYNEVKAEEKMRVVHDRKVSKLKRLDQRGAEATKVDTTRTLIRSLSTKIRMAIKVVDGISVKISTIRDEELWPQLNELIKGLTRMWKSMLECHRSQCQAIREAKGLGSIGPGKKLSDSHIKATLELEHELIRWTDTFSSWINAQKGYVKALNNWLLKCLYDEPEETEDGPAPFSPSRIGAPPVFVICNRWSQAMDRISEKEVVDCMRVFTYSVLQIWEHDKNEMRQRMMVNKDLERMVKNLDREDQKIQKEMQALDKKMVLFTQDGNIHSDEQIVYPSDTSNRSIQASLQHIFEAMEKFMDESMKAYQELQPLGE
ncbi:nitrate regulatory gene2 protein-like [Quercus lobata]|uniref:nitrate regulatory gene2 protein-like n=1 Tax=Quercus lobata TaxID=97700 RepID=UPI0012483AB4|nr:nitrate regulatory gene2 protein-like [Quercus lobata]